MKILLSRLMFSRGSTKAEELQDAATSARTPETVDLRSSEAGLRYDFQARWSTCSP